MSEPIDRAKPADFAVSAFRRTGTVDDSARRSIDEDDTVCPRCSESQELAKVKGCVKCLKCGFKFDCNGW